MDGVKEENRRQIFTNFYRQNLALRKTIHHQAFLQEKCSTAFLIAKTESTPEDGREMEDGKQHFSLVYGI